MTFTSDELILTLISLVRATRPAMLSQESDGFVVDFEALSAKTNLDFDDRLLLKMRAVLEPPSPEGISTPQPDLPDAPDRPLTLELDAAERLRLANTLGHLETLQAWPADVLAMSRALRIRLASDS
jgi:hypothetical protein